MCERIARPRGETRPGDGRAASALAGGGLADAAGGAPLHSHATQGGRGLGCHRNLADGQAVGASGASGAAVGVAAPAGSGLFLYSSGRLGSMG